ncbi:MAG: LacI family DNA-binding transcriptional regulator [Chloroflexota bacterium]
MARPKRDIDVSNPRVTIQDVAELAGVSVATVSRVLNSHPDVSPATRSDVLRHARDLGYVSNRVAILPSIDARARRRTRLIGLSVPAARSEYVAEIVVGAMEALHDRDARLVICSEGRAPTSLTEQLMPGVTDGALLVLPTDGKEDLAGLQESGYPFVVIEPTMALDAGMPAVAATNWAGARSATEYLVEMGHTHIGIITGPDFWQISQDRLAGYHAALLAAGLPMVPHLHRNGELSIESGYRMTRELLALAHVPTAIFALSTELALGALRAAREDGLRVPDDLSLVTFDDVATASITTPTITAVRQPLQGQGRMGAEMLYRLLEGQQLDATRIELSTDLVVRESTAAPRGGSFLT